MFDGAADRWSRSSSKLTGCSEKSAGLELDLVHCADHKYFKPYV